MEFIIQLPPLRLWRPWRFPSSASPAVVPLQSSENTPRIEFFSLHSSIPAFLRISRPNDRSSPAIWIRSRRCGIAPSPLDSALMANPKKRLVVVGDRVLVAPEEGEER